MTEVELMVLAMAEQSKLRENGVLDRDRRFIVLDGTGQMLTFTGCVFKAQEWTHEKHGVMFRMYPNQAIMVGDER